MKEKTILLVEDNPNDQMLMLRALNKNQIANKVVIARDGAEALDYLFGTGDFEGRNTSNVPQVIMLDLKLPKIDGLEVLKRLRANEQTKYIPVIILTTSIEQGDVIKSYNLGANSYVQKPINFEDFMEATRQLGLYWLVINRTVSDN